MDVPQRYLDQIVGLAVYGASETSHEDPFEAAKAFEAIAPHVGEELRQEVLEQAAYIRQNEEERLEALREVEEVRRHRRLHPRPAEELRRMYEFEHMSFAPLSEVEEETWKQVPEAWVRAANERMAKRRKDNYLQTVLSVRDRFAQAVRASSGKEGE